MRTALFVVPLAACTVEAPLAEVHTVEPVDVWAPEGREYAGCDYALRNQDDYLLVTGVHDTWGNEVYHADCFVEDGLPVRIFEHSTDGVRDFVTVERSWDFDQELYTVRSVTHRTFEGPRLTMEEDEHRARLLSYDDDGRLVIDLVLYDDGSSL